MKIKKTRKVSIRVHPTVVEGLKLVADVDSMTVSDYLRGCLDYVFTGNPKNLPSYIRGEGLGAFFTVEDIKGWQDLIDILSEPS
jgi:hypothetical protein